jgi:hypothetical protein
MMHGKDCSDDEDQKGRTKSKKNLLDITRMPAFEVAGKAQQP